MFHTVTIKYGLKKLNMLQKVEKLDSGLRMLSGGYWRLLLCINSSIMFSHFEVLQHVINLQKFVTLVTELLWQCACGSVQNVYNKLYTFLSFVEKLCFDIYMQTSCGILLLVLICLWRLIDDVSCHFTIITDLRAFTRLTRIPLIMFCEPLWFHAGPHNNKCICSIRRSAATRDSTHFQTHGNLWLSKPQQTLTPELIPYLYAVFSPVYTQ